MVKSDEQKSQEWIVYILECSDNTFYTGVTNNLPNRIELHSAGKGARYTRGRSPLSLIYSEKCATKSIALKREWEEKETLISG